MSASNKTCATKQGRTATITERCLSRLRIVWEAEGAKGLLCLLWMQFWMIFAGRSFLGRIASRLAACAAPPYYDRYRLSGMNKKGYVSTASTIHHKSLQLGDHILIDDGVIIFQEIYQGEAGGKVTVGRCVRIYRDVIIQTGQGGRVVIGDESYIHPRCIISAYKGSVLIGRGVGIAANCSFYPYNHGVASGIPIKKQPLTSSGDITIGDGAWIGAGVIVLDGAKIGKGAVIGAGSVVTRDIPDNAIACGVPAKVVKMRGD